MERRKSGTRRIATMLAIAAAGAIPATVLGASPALAECEFGVPVSVSNARVYEGTYWGATTNLSFTLTASNIGPRNPGGKITVSAVSGSAVAGSDFEFATRQIDVYSSPITVNVPVMRDVWDEPNETMSLKLSNPWGCVYVKNGTGTGEILDDDGPLTWNVDDARANEGSSFSQMKFRVSLSKPQTAPVTVHYRTTWAYTANGASPGVDYYEVSDHTVTVPANASYADASVWLIGDTKCEGFGAEKYFLVQIFNPSTGSVADGTARGTIVDDDAYLPCQ